MSKELSEQRSNFATCTVNLVSKNCDEGFSIDIEDYLIGQLTLASELVQHICSTVVLISVLCAHVTAPLDTLQSRLCVNAVVASDLTRPARVHAFLVQLDAGFRLLMLKNDSLRRRYDALKYDLKRVEEVTH